VALILNIDTSLETASVSLAKDGSIISFETNEVQKDHASFLHVAIAGIFKKNGVSANDIDAIAVTEGPGSYTGLRVGMATAKGLCFAAEKPFITINTLEAMTASLIHEGKRSDLYAPMIDARRMEVFTAVYNEKLEQILQPCPMIVDKQSFGDLLTNSKMMFFGSGAKKFQSISQHSNAMFAEQLSVENGVAELSYKKFYDKNFTELINSEPLYLKAFQDSR